METRYVSPEVRANRIMAGADGDLSKAIDLVVHLSLASAFGNDIMGLLNPMSDGRLYASAVIEYLIKIDLRRRLGGLSY